MCALFRTFETSHAASAIITATVADRIPRLEDLFLIPDMTDNVSTHVRFSSCVHGVRGGHVADRGRQLILRRTSQSGHLLLMYPSDLYI